MVYTGVHFRSKYELANNEVVGPVVSAAARADGMLIGVFGDSGC